MELFLTIILFLVVFGLAVLLLDMIPLVFTIECKKRRDKLTFWFMASILGVGTATLILSEPEGWAVLLTGVLCTICFYVLLRMINLCVFGNKKEDIKEKIEPPSNISGDISRLFYNRRGWNVIAKGDGIFKLTREAYSWIIEEVYIDLNKESYTKFKGKTIDPDIKQEVDYELETFGLKSLYDKFQLPLAWTFGGEHLTHYRQYTYRRWASEIFQLCLIQSWLYISEHSSAYYSDHLFDR